VRELRLDALSDHLAQAAAALGAHGCALEPSNLDDAAARLAEVEVLLELLAGDATADVARQLRSLRDSVSGHLSAAASLRLLDLDANAALVLERAVDTARGPMALFGDSPYRVPFSDAG